MACMCRTIYALLRWCFRAFGGEGEVASAFGGSDAAFVCSGLGTNFKNGTAGLAGIPIREYALCTNSLK